MQTATTGKKEAEASYRRNAPETKTRTNYSSKGKKMETFKLGHKNIVDFFEMTFDLALSYLSGIQRNDLFVQTIEMLLILLNELRLELCVAVARNFDLDLSAFAVR